VVYLVTTLLQNFPQNVLVKNFKNRSIFGKDMDKNLRLTFWPNLHNLHSITSCYICSIVCKYVAHNV